MDTEIKNDVRTVITLITKSKFTSMFPNYKVIDDSQMLFGMLVNKKVFPAYVELVDGRKEVTPEGLLEYKFILKVTVDVPFDVEFKRLDFMLHEIKQATVDGYFTNDDFLSLVNEVTQVKLTYQPTPPIYLTSDANLFLIPLDTETVIPVRMEFDDWLSIFGLFVARSNIEGAVINMDM